MIRVLIVDDELPSLKKLEKQLIDSGKAEVAGAFNEPLKALDFAVANKLDVVFLDIEMPDLDGLEFANRIFDMKIDLPVVFVTAYNQYAIEAFQLNALDYLLKPVLVDRLMETLDRVIKRKNISLLSGALSIHCFGRFCVKAGTEEIRFRTEKARELLAFLIDSRGRYVSRNNIIDSLWEDFEGDRAIVHFNTTLYNVKKALLPYEQVSIVYDQGNYRLKSEGIICDYLKFCEYIQTYKSISPGNIKKLEEMALLYEGEYLSGWDYEWVGGKRLFLEDQFIKLLLQLALYYKSSGEYLKASEWLKTGLVYEPLHRELNYRLLEVLLLSNERILANKYFCLYREGLLRKLKAEPDVSFMQLLKPL